MKINVTRCEYKNCTKKCFGAMYCSPEHHSWGVSERMIQNWKTDGHKWNELAKIGRKLKPKGYWSLVMERNRIKSELKKTMRKAGD